MSNKILRKVLVTGGGGFLGKGIVRRLVGRGNEVRSYSRGFYPELESLGVEQIQGDIRDKVSVEFAVKGMDVIFHVAAKPGIWGDSGDFFNTNVSGTQNVIDACREYGVPILVYTSSPSVIFNGKHMEGVDETVPYPDKYHADYPKTKALAEQAVLRATTSSLRTMILRPHLIWGPGDNHLVPRIIARAKNLVRVGNGKNLVDTIYIDNAADAHILAAEKLDEIPGLSGGIYFISQGEPVYLWDMINDILRAAGLDPVKRSVPRWTAWLIGAALEFLYKTFAIKDEPRMTRFLANELATAHWFDISAAKNNLGYSPKVSTQEGLRRLETWLRAQIP